MYWEIWIRLFRNRAYFWELFVVIDQEHHTHTQRGQEHRKIQKKYSEFTRIYRDFYFYLSFQKWRGEKKKKQQSIRHKIHILPPILLNRYYMLCKLSALFFLNGFCIRTCAWKKDIKTSKIYFILENPTQFFLSCHWS